jgi:rubrerythrin
VVDTVVMPCMHAVMCNWCAELQIPGKRGTPCIARDRTAKCPLCRARVKEKRKIFHS